jgi:hypothetical protein
LYYLWLVVPFKEQLHILAILPGSGDLGSFLWPAGLKMDCTIKRKSATQADKSLHDGDFYTFSANVEEPWESAQLGLVIKEAFRRGLQTKASTLLWRHASIAISRRHLPEGYKFKRDYGPDEENSAIDLQAAHTSRMAGVCYARDVREGYGHVASLRSEFRGLSRNWHTCLGLVCRYRRVMSVASWLVVSLILRQVKLWCTETLQASLPHISGHVKR